MDKNSIKKPVISVCIANYNGETYISECIDSVINQTIDLPLEIIIHDDASTDNSVTLIENHYPEIRLIKSESNVGYCVSNNRMAKSAKGHYLLLLNNDAQLHPDAIKTLYDSASINSNAVIGLPQYDRDTRQLLDIGSFVDLFLNPVPNQDANRKQVAMVIGACLWIPASVWDEIDGFPDWFESLAEDMYMCMVARLMGYPVIALGNSGYSHYVGKTLGGGKIKGVKLSTTYSRRKLSERNKSFVMAICYPHLLFLTITPLHIVLLYLEGLFLTILKSDRKIWNLIYKDLLTSVWNNKIKLYTLRKKVQKSRRISIFQFLSAFVWYPYKLKMLIKYGLPKLK